MFERFRKKAPTPAERERVSDAHAAADPTTYSALPPSTELTYAGTVRERGEGRNYLNKVYEAEGDTWYELAAGMSPEAQQVAARLLKGIVPVADVVEKDGKYYSKLMKHEDIEERISEDEARADFELIHLLLDDSDHTLVGDPRNVDNGTGHNARLHDGTATYHDFSGAYFDRADPGMRRKTFTEKGYARLLENLARTKAQYDSPQGRTLAESMYRSAPEGSLPSGSKTFDEFYELLLSRIRSGEARVKAAQADQYGTPVSEPSSEG